MAVRNRDLQHSIDQLLARLTKRSGEDGDSVRVFTIAYGDSAADDVLVRRFSETRRPHPLAEDGDVIEGIRAERERLASLRTRAKHVIDTTTTRAVKAAIPPTTKTISHSNVPTPGIRTSS